MSLDGHYAARSTVAVIGATGHTGKFVVAELLGRGLKPIAIARTEEALFNANFPAGEVVCRQASLDNQASLCEALQGARAVINCAGPFLDTADAAIAAAIKSGIHYLDVSAEQMGTIHIFETYGGPARDAGVSVVPAVGFFGGFVDLLVTAAILEWDFVDSIEFMIGLDSWHPTGGTRATAKRNTARRLVVANGALVPMSLPPTQKQWDFRGPLGWQTVLETPFTEVILVSRHVKTTTLNTYFNETALADVRNEETPAPRPDDHLGRSSQRFVVDVVASWEGQRRRAVARGQDIYAFSAPLICEVTERLLNNEARHSGADAPGAMFNARSILAALQPTQVELVLSRE